MNIIKSGSSIIKQNVFDEYTPTAKKRIVAVDLLKLFALLMVIFSHCCFCFLDDAYYCSPICNVIWLLQMPLFVFASGITFRSENKFKSFKDFLLFLAKDFLSLFLPCLTYHFIRGLLFGSNLISLMMGVYQIFVNPETNLWFLWVLLMIRVSLGLFLFLNNRIAAIIKIKTNNSVFWLSIIFELLLAVLISILILLKKVNGTLLSLKLFSYYVPFFILGYLFKRIICNSKIMNKKQFRIISFCLLLICFITFLIIVLGFKSIYSFNDYDIKLLIVRFVGSISGIYCFLILCNYLSKLKFFIVASFFGKFSLQSYYIHIIVLPFFASLSANLSIYNWLLSLVVMLILVSIVFSLILVLYFIPFGHLAVFGRSYSPYKFEKKLPQIFR